MEFLITWLIQRLLWVYQILVATLGLPVWAASIVAGTVVLLFFYCLFDLFLHRNKGEIALSWLIIIILIPFATFLYLIFGRAAVRKAPIHLSRATSTPVSHGAPTPEHTTSATAWASPVSPVSQQNIGIAQQQKKYFLGTTTVLGSTIAIIAVAAGAIALVFFIFVIIALIQCANDPKCM
jgi:Ca2+/Na+ antiporter